MPQPSWQAWSRVSRSAKLETKHLTQFWASSQGWLIIGSHSIPKTLVRIFNFAQLSQLSGSSGAAGMKLDWQQQRGWWGSGRERNCCKIVDCCCVRWLPLFFRLFSFAVFVRKEVALQVGQRGLLRGQTPASNVGALCPKWRHRPTQPPTSTHLFQLCTFFSCFQPKLPMTAHFKNTPTTQGFVGERGSAWWQGGPYWEVAHYPWLPQVPAHSLPWDARIPRILLPVASMVKTRAQFVPPSSINWLISLSICSETCESFFFHNNPEFTIEHHQFFRVASLAGLHLLNFLLNQQISYSNFSDVWKYYSQSCIYNQNMKTYNNWNFGQRLHNSRRRLQRRQLWLFYIRPHRAYNLHNLTGSGIHKLWQSPWTWCQGHILKAPFGPLFMLFIYFFCQTHNNLRNLTISWLNRSRVLELDGFWRCFDQSCLSRCYDVIFCVKILHIIFILQSFARTKIWANQPIVPDLNPPPYLVSNLLQKIGGSWFCL